MNHDVKLGDRFQVNENYNHPPFLVEVGFAHEFQLKKDDLLTVTEEPFQRETLFGNSRYVKVKFVREEDCCVGVVCCDELIARATKLI